ncbi:MAG: radical SAM protein [Nitrospirae bacterium]|nr:radical SAM protein [Nitrospirota bacterium]
MKKVLLYSPPGGLWLRGEARCEQELENATAFTTPAPTSLCYMAAVFQQKHLQAKIVDCPIEGVTAVHFDGLIKSYAPNMAILNASVLNLIEDLKTIERINTYSSSIIHCVVLPYFNSVPLEKISPELFRHVDIIMVGEMEGVAYDLADYINGKITIEQIRGIVYHDKATGNMVKNAPMPPIDDLNTLPMPARELIRNELYLRPDVGRPMASIVDGRGCPSDCIYCLSPITTGKKVRKRSVDSVVAEINECGDKYKIRDFLFRSDAFTIRKDWVLEFCKKITDQRLKISWAANSKTISFDDEIAVAMKNAGCFLVEFGIESGSDKSLKLQKKGTTVEAAKRAVAAAKRAGLLTYGTILLGFPWEEMKDLLETEQLIHMLKLDFIEVQVAAPYVGTELYDMMMKEGLIEGDTIGHDMIRNPAVKGTRYVSRAELLAFRKRFLRRFYMRPFYAAKTIMRISSLRQLEQYFSYGVRLLKNILKEGI